MLSFSTSFLHPSTFREEPLKKKKIIALITELLNLASKKYESYLRICEFLSPQSQYSALLCEKHLKSIFTLKEKYN